MGSISSITCYELLELLHTNISGISTMPNISISLKSFKNHIQIPFHSWRHPHSTPPQKEKKTLEDTTEIQMVSIMSGNF